MGVSLPALGVPGGGGGPLIIGGGGGPPLAFGGGGGPPLIGGGGGGPPDGLGATPGGSCLGLGCSVIIDIH